MAEFPDANSGGLDPSGVPSCKRARPGRTRVYLLLGAILVVVCGMAIGGCFWVLSAFRPGHVWDDRLYAVLGSIGLIAPLYAGTRGYIKAQRNRGRVSVQCNPETRPPVQCAPGVCNAKAGSLAMYLIKWSGYAAMQPTCPTWQRAAAWLVIILCGAAILALTGFGIVMIGAGLGTMPSGLGIVAIGLAALIWPFIAVRSLVRGIRAGKVGTTREEFEQFRAAYQQWRTGQSQMPLRKKLINTATMLACVGFLWLHNVLRYPGKDGNWIVPAIWAVPLAYSIWAQFRRCPSDTSR